VRCGANKLVTRSLKLHPTDLSPIDQAQQVWTVIDGKLAVGRLYENGNSRSNLRWFGGPNLGTKNSLAPAVSQIGVEPNIPT
jgi:hypothetical protein